MPYTLMKGLAWILLAVLLGIVVGWLMRSVAAKRQVSRARNHHVDAAEMERLKGRVANLEQVAAERDRLQLELDRLRSKPSVTPTGEQAPVVATTTMPFSAVETAGPGPEVPAPRTTPDTASAAAVLGSAVTLDDLRVVEGIGPKIESLLHGIGIRTWFDLSTTEVSLLRTMLADAGPRFKTQDPSTWPEQAALLAAGR
ncbi:MAG: hypothetical protein ABIO83_02165, partial [Ilumatobacteraceae bacterium]